MTENYIDSIIHESAQKAVAEDRIFDYVAFWLTAPRGQQERAKKILREEIQKGIH